MLRRIAVAAAVAGALGVPAHADPPPPVPPLTVVGLYGIICEHVNCHVCVEWDCLGIPHDTCVSDDFTGVNECAPTGDDFPYDAVPTSLIPRV